MVLFKIAFRNLFRQKRRTVFTALSMFGGFVLAAFFIGFADGAYNGIIDIFTRNRLGHIQIHKKDYLDNPSIYKTIDDVDEINNLLENTKKVENWTPRLFSAGLVSVGEETAGAQITGIDPEKENLTTHFEKKIVKGRNFSSEPSHEAILGKGLAKILKTGLNEEVIIISQAADGSIANDIYTIVGISETGNDTEDRISFFLHIKDAQKLFVLDERIHEMAITVESLNDVRKTTQVLKQELSDTELSVAPWQVFARSFYIAMKADKEGMWIMLVIIMIIVAVGVLNTVLMSVLERQREYGVLRAVGTKPAQIIKLVLAELNIIAVICVVAGAIIAFLLNSFFVSHGIELSNPINYGGMEFKSMYSEVNARSFYIPAIVVILSATFVGIFPALKAAHTDPAKSMRFH